MKFANVKEGEVIVVCFVKIHQYRGTKVKQKYIIFIVFLKSRNKTNIGDEAILCFTIYFLIRKKKIKGDNLTAFISDLGETNFFVVFF
jgi:hypothetical protein